MAMEKNSNFWLIFHFVFLKYIMSMNLTLLFILQASVNLKVR